MVGAESCGWSLMRRSGDQRWPVSSTTQEKSRRQRRSSKRASSASSPGHAQVSSRLSEVLLDHWCTTVLTKGPPLVQKHMMHLQQLPNEPCAVCPDALSESIRHLCHNGARGRGQASQANPTTSWLEKKLRNSKSPMAPKATRSGEAADEHGVSPGKGNEATPCKVYDQQIEQGWSQRHSALPGFWRPTHHQKRPLLESAPFSVKKFQRSSQSFRYDRYPEAVAWE